jgi:hypothetical protein
MGKKTEVKKSKIEIEYYYFDINKLNEKIEYDEDDESEEKTKKIMKHPIFKMIFKIHEGQYLYITKEKEIVIRKCIKHETDSLPKKVLSLWKTHCLPYTVEENVASRKIVDHEKRVINTYPQPRFLPTEDKIDMEKIQPFLDFLWNNVCLGKQDKIKWISIYIKMLVHDMKTLAVPYLYSPEQGIGKSLAINIISEIIGERRTQPVSMQNWSEKFNSYVNSFLLTTQESKDENLNSSSTDYSNAIENIKNCCTESKVQVRKMRENLTSNSNTICNLIMSANHLLKYKDMNGRRFFMFQMFKNNFNKIDYIEKSLRDNEIMQHLFNYFYYYGGSSEAFLDVKLQNLEIEDNTELKDEMNEITISSINQYLAKIVQENPVELDVVRSNFNRDYEDFCKTSKLYKCNSVNVKIQIQQTQCITCHKSGVEKYKIDCVKLKEYLITKGCKFEIVEKLEEQELSWDDVLYDERTTLKQVMTENLKLKARIEELEKLLNKK